MNLEEPFYAIVFYTICDHGKTVAQKDTSNEVNFTWNQVNHANHTSTGYWSPP
jgi:hypothetical protein